MRVAIDISPLESGHKVRGTGFYLEHLRQALLTYQKQHEYLFFSGLKNIPEKIDILHFPYFDPFFITLPFFKHYKTVVTVHDVTPLVFPKHFPSGLKGRLKWQMQKTALKRVDRIIADSHCSQQDIARIVGYPEKKIDVVYLAAGEAFERFKIDDSRLKNIIEKYSLPEKFVLYVGDVTWNKNVPRLVEAAIQAQVPLVMVGKALAQEHVQSQNPWLSDLRKTLELVRGKSTIYRLGFVPSEDLVGLYNAATVFVMPSLYEGFGLPILEAMACGTPVITGKEGSVPEVAGEGAYYVDVNHTESIAQGLEEVFTNSALQATLRKNGFEQEKNFSWKKTAEETVRSYEKAFNTK